MFSKNKISEGNELMDIQLHSLKRKSDYIMDVMHQNIKIAKAAESFKDDEYLVNLGYLEYMDLASKLGCCCDNIVMNILPETKESTGMSSQVQIVKTLKDIIKEKSIVLVRQFRNGVIQVIVNNIDSAKQLLKIRTFGSKPVKITTNLRDFESTFIVHNVDKDLELKDCVQEIKNNSIFPTRIKKLFYKENTNKCWLIISCLGKFIPSSIKINYQLLPVSKFVYKPSICSSCWSSYHKKCSYIICRNCSQKHNTEKCDNPPCCKYCKSAHKTLDEEMCPEWKRILDIFQIITEKNVTRLEATKLYHDSRKSSNYAKVTSEGSIMQCLAPNQLSKICNMLLNDSNFINNIVDIIKSKLESTIRDMVRNIIQEEFDKMEYDVPMSTTMPKGANLILQQDNDIGDNIDINFDQIDDVSTISIAEPIISDILKNKSSDVEKLVRNKIKSSFLPKKGTNPSMKKTKKKKRFPKTRIIRIKARILSTIISVTFLLLLLLRCRDGSSALWCMLECKKHFSKSSCAQFRAF